MKRSITQRELRNDSGKVMQALDAGESFLVTRNGVPVGELVPVRRRTFVSAKEALATFIRTGRVDAKRFREDVDAILDQDPTPRA